MREERDEKEERIDEKTDDTLDVRELILENEETELTDDRDELESLTELAELLFLIDELLHVLIRQLWQTEGRLVGTQTPFSHPISTVHVCPLLHGVKPQSKSVVQAFASCAMQ